jgi:LPS export ABC transporter protein LptC
LVETKDGKMLWEVWGDRGEVFEKEGVAKVMKITNPVTVMLYSEQGKLTARSESATVNMRTKDIRLERNVMATSEQGNSLRTQSLDWSAKDRRVFTRLPVTLVRGGLTSSGVGMEAETDLERVRFLSRVRSHVIPGDGGPTTKERSSPQNGGTQ